MFAWSAGTLRAGKGDRMGRGPVVKTNPMGLPGRDHVKTNPTGCTSAKRTQRPKFAEQSQRPKLAEQTQVAKAQHAANAQHARGRVPSAGNTWTRLRPRSPHPVLRQEFFHQPGALHWLLDLQQVPAAGDEIIV